MAQPNEVGFGVLFESLRASLEGRRAPNLPASAANGAAIFSLTEPSGARAAMTVLLNPAGIQVLMGHRSDPEKAFALIRGSVGSVARYILEADERALHELRLYGSGELLLQIGAALRNRTTILAHRAASDKEAE